MTAPPATVSSVYGSGTRRWTTAKVLRLPPGCLWVNRLQVPITPTTGAMSDAVTIFGISCPWRQRGPHSPCILHGCPAQVTQASPRHYNCSGEDVALPLLYTGHLHPRSLFVSTAGGVCRLEYYAREVPALLVSTRVATGASLLLQLLLVAKLEIAAYSRGSAWYSS